MSKARDIFQVEIRTRDLSRSVNFYAAVFDWKIYKAAESYALVDTGAMPVVGILQTANPIFPLGFVNHLRVEDCEREAARAVGLGGRLNVPKSEIAGSGLYIGVVDPWGTELYYWQPYSDKYPKPEGSGVNPVSYVEISAPDVPAAIKFYSELTGWSFSGVVFEDGVAMARGYGLKRGIGLIEGPPGSLDYIEVTNLEETGDRVRAAGGAVLVPPTDFPGEGRYMIFENPDGVRVGAVQPMA